MGLSNLLFQPHEIPISISWSSLLIATHPPVPLSWNINPILAHEIAQLFYLCQDLSLFSPVQTDPNEAPALWATRPKCAHQSCHSPRHSASPKTGPGHQGIAQISLQVPISAQIRADSVSAERHNPKSLCTSNFLLSWA